MKRLKRIKSSLTFYEQCDSNQGKFEGRHDVNYYESINNAIEQKG
jgi:hypothetical protein